LTKKPQPRTQAKRSFQWGISSHSVEFGQNRELGEARDGSASDCSSYVSPLPRPKREPADPDQERE
jgi:hypothetical protein